MRGRKDVGIGSVLQEESGSVKGAKSQLHGQGSFTERVEGIDIGASDEQRVGHGRVGIGQDKTHLVGLGHVQDFNLGKALIRHLGGEVVQIKVVASLMLLFGKEEAK